LAKYGKPTTQGNARKINAKIDNALIDIDTVWDAQANPADFARFCSGGDWSDPDDLGAMAACILRTLINVQEKSLGEAEQALRLPGDFRGPKPNDVVFNFHQRRHCMTLLLKHFTSRANRFMRGVGLKAHVARNWSVLLMQPALGKWWVSLNGSEQSACLEENLYGGLTWNDETLSHPNAPAAPNVTAQNYQQAQTGDPSRVMPLSDRTAGERPMVDGPATEAGPSSKRRLTEISTLQAPQQQGGRESTDLESLTLISPYFASLQQAGSVVDHSAVPQVAARDPAQAGTVEGNTVMPYISPQLAQEVQVDETWWNENIGEDADLDHADDEPVEEGSPNE
jgi:hypothetical protein